MDGNVVRNNGQIGSVVQMPKEKMHYWPADIGGTTRTERIILWTRNYRIRHLKDLAFFHKVLVHIAAIFKAEEKSAEERQICRQKEVAPLVEAYFAWVHERDPATILSEKSRDEMKTS